MVNLKVFGAKCQATAKILVHICNTTLK